MIGFRALRFSLLGLSCLLAVTGGAKAEAPVAARAASTELYNPSSPPPALSSIPAFSRLVDGGAKLYYMGERSGIYGWLVIKNGQIQMMYVSQDLKTVLIGGLFTADGNNVTSHQVADLVKNNVEIKTLLDGTARQEKAIAEAGQKTGGVASVAAGTGSTKAPGDLPSTPISPGERLVNDLKAAGGVTLGQNEKTEVYMVVAPKCPNCKKTWEELKESVHANKMQVRLIPVFNSAGDEEKNYAARLLRAKEPLAAWDRFVGGDVSALSGGEPEAIALRAVDDNMKLVAKWNIQGYPYIVYRGRDGRIKIVQGRPDRMAAILADVL